MRIRNIVGVDEMLKGNSYFIDTLDNGSVDWQAVFNNNNPIHLEIGMGKGQFLKTLAERNTDINYVGMDKSKELLWKSCKLLDDTKLLNIKITNQRAENLELIFPSSGVERIYLNFSDPWPKDRHYKRRLTHNGFLQRYKNVLVSKGEIHFKTDGLALFEFSLEEVKQMKGIELKEVNFDLHKEEPIDNVMTEYEEKFVNMGKAIYKFIAVVE